MILRGPVGRSGDEAEDGGPSERVGLGVRRSRPLLAVFLGRAIEVIKILKATKDEHRGSKGGLEKRKRNQAQTKSVGVDHDVSVSCQIPFLGLIKPLNKKYFAAAGYLEFEMSSSRSTAWASQLPPARPSLFLG